jgi:hypothetical protein
LNRRRRVAAVATITLGALIVAGPAHAQTPVKEIDCKKAGNEVEDSTVPTAVENRRRGLLGLTNSFNNVLANIDLLNVVPIDKIDIEDVQLIENVNILGNMYAVSANCR